MPELLLIIIIAQLFILLFLTLQLTRLGRLALYIRTNLEDSES